MSNYSASFRTSFVFLLYRSPFYFRYCPFFFISYTQLLPCGRPSPFSFTPLILLLLPFPTTTLIHRIDGPSGDPYGFSHSSGAARRPSWKSRAHVRGFARTVQLGKGEGKREKQKRYNVNKKKQPQSVCPLRPMIYQILFFFLPRFLSFYFILIPT